MLQDRELTKKVKRNGSDTLECSEGQNGLSSVIHEGEESIRSTEADEHRSERILPAVHNEPDAASGTLFAGSAVGTGGSVLPPDVDSDSPNITLLVNPIPVPTSVSDGLLGSRTAVNMPPNAVIAIEPDLGSQVANSTGPATLEPNTVLPAASADVNPVLPAAVVGADRADASPTLPATANSGGSADAHSEDSDPDSESDDPDLISVTPINIAPDSADVKPSIAQKEQLVSEGVEVAGRRGTHKARGERNRANPPKKKKNKKSKVGTISELLAKRRIQMEGSGKTGASPVRLDLEMEEQERPATTVTTQNTTVTIATPLLPPVSYLSGLASSLASSIASPSVLTSAVSFALAAASSVLPTASSAGDPLATAVATSGIRAPPSGQDGTGSQPIAQPLLLMQQQQQQQQQEQQEQQHVQQLEQNVTGKQNTNVNAAKAWEKRKKRKIKKGGRTRQDSASDIAAWDAMLSDMSGSELAPGPPSANAPSPDQLQQNPGIKGLEGMSTEEVEANADRIVQMLVSRILSKHPEEVKAGQQQQHQPPQPKTATKRKKRGTSTEKKREEASVEARTGMTASTTPNIRLSTDDNNSNLSSGTAWSFGSLLSPTGSVSGVLPATLNVQPLGLGLPPATNTGTMDTTSDTVLDTSATGTDSPSSSPAGMIPVTSPPPTGALPGVASFSALHSGILSGFAGVSVAAAAAAAASLPVALHSSTVTTSASPQYLQQKLDSRTLLGLAQQTDQNQHQQQAQSGTASALSSTLSPPTQLGNVAQSDLLQISSSRCITFGVGNKKEVNDVAKASEVKEQQQSQQVCHHSLSEASIKLPKDWTLPRANGLVDTKQLMEDSQVENDELLNQATVPNMALLFGGQNSALDLSSKVLKTEKLDAELASMAREVQQAMSQQVPQQDGQLVQHDHDQQQGPVALAANSASGGGDSGTTTTRVLASLGDNNMDVDLTGQPAVQELADTNVALVERLRTNQMEEVPQCECLGNSEYFRGGWSCGLV